MNEEEIFSAYLERNKQLENKVDTTPQLIELALNHFKTLNQSKVTIEEIQKFIVEKESGISIDKVMSLTQSISENLSWKGIRVVNGNAFSDSGDAWYN